MNTFEIEVLNPKAIKLLKDLADLKLITLKKAEKETWESMLKKLRRNASSAPFLEEITEEVELVRAEMYAEKNR
jgi:hypothetical protein